MSIKIYAMSDDNCWYASETAEGAVQCYRDDYLLDDELTAQAIASWEYDLLTYHDDDGQRTFREELLARISRNESFPQFFASTDY
jgi:hypothetical protein